MKALPLSTKPCLDRLKLPGTLWFAADMHLSADNPKTRADFLGFLEHARQHANALLLLGDIFDVWVGDDVIERPAPWLSEILGALAYTAIHCPLFIARGNRDFLMGHRLADTLGATLLPEQTHLQTDWGDVLASHGDEYCTDDLAYQRFKHWVRKPWLQSLFLGLGLGLRNGIARHARKRSQANQQAHNTPNGITDVNQIAVEQVLQRHNSQFIIHGHTHRPACHAMSHVRAGAQRWVLTDWDGDDDYHPRGGWLSLSRLGIREYSLYPNRRDATLFNPQHRKPQNTV